MYTWCSQQPLTTSKMKRKLSPAKKGAIYNEGTEMKLELEQNEVEFIINVLGELPTKSNAFVLLQKLLQQAQSQMPVEQTSATA